MNVNLTLALMVLLVKVDLIVSSVTVYLVLEVLSVNQESMIVLPIHV